MPACLSYRPICVALPADSSAKPVIRPSAASWLSCASRSASAVSASRSCACWSGVVPGWAANCASAASSCGLGLAIPGSFPGSGSVQSTDGLHAKSPGFPGDHALRNDRDRDVVLVIAPTPELSDLALRGCVPIANRPERFVEVLKITLTERLQARNVVPDIADVQHPAFPPST